MLQSWLSLSDPEQLPPLRSVLVLVRDLVLVPSPQDLEQDDQGDQLPQKQSAVKHQFKIITVFPHTVSAERRAETI